MVDVHTVAFFQDATHFTEGFLAIRKVRNTQKSDNLGRNTRPAH